MPYASTGIHAFLVLSSSVVLITAQDTSTMFFPSNGNGSSLELGAGKIIDSMFHPDATRTPSTLIQQQLLPQSYYLPALQPPFGHHRSESLPYAFEYPNVAYPVAQSVEQAIAPTSKQLVIVSFIGLLLLLAIIQNTIAAAKRKDVLSEDLPSKRKRDVRAVYDLRSMTPEEETILNDDARVRCIQRTICLENRKLLKDLGGAGRILAKYLTRNIEKSAKSFPGWDRLIDDAGSAGTHGEDCEVLYRDCETPLPFLPQAKLTTKKETSINP